MKIIYKYEVPIHGGTLILPKGAQFLALQTQHNRPHLWFLVDHDEKLTEEHVYLVVGTGTGTVSKLDTYLGTFQLNSGNLVFHVFEQL